MNKYLLITFALLITLSSYSQYFEDNLDSYTTGSTTGGQNDWWSTWSGTLGTSEDGLVSSEQSSTAPNSLLIAEGAVQDVLLLLGNRTTGLYTLSWKMYIPTNKRGYYNFQQFEAPGTYAIDLFFNKDGLSPGAGVIEQSNNNIATFSYPQNTWFDIVQVIDLEADTIEITINGTLAYNGNFFSNSHLGAIDFYSIDGSNRYYIDDIVYEATASATTDLSLSNLNLANTIVQGATNIEGTVTNLGSDSINSFDLSWQVDGGTTYTDNFSGLNIETGIAYNFTHSDLWNATVGSYNMVVWISNINNNGADEVSENDEIIKDVVVASDITDRLPLYEEFTSSTCAPCATFHNTSFTLAYLNNNIGNYALIKYQMSWPAPGDPYYTAEGGTRRTYYNINSVPTLLLNKEPGTFSNTAALQTALDSELQVPAFYVLTAFHEINGQDINVDVTIDPYLSGNFTLNIAVVEKTTTANTGNNGETSFEHVMMKMVPNASGTSVSLTAGTTLSETLSASLAGTNIEEMDDLEVIVFLQDDSDKSILQSAISTNGPGVGIDDFIFETVSLYPNPSEGLLTIETEHPLEIKIYTILGKQVFYQNNVTNHEILNLATIPSGLYLISINNGVLSGTTKLIIE